MEWKEYSEKFKKYKDEFNNQEFDERVRTSKLMMYDSIGELIRSKQHLKDAIKKIDDRIKVLYKEL